MWECWGTHGEGRWQMQMQRAEGKREAGNPRSLWLAFFCTHALSREPHPPAWDQHRRSAVAPPIAARSEVAPLRPPYNVASRVGRPLCADSAPQAPINPGATD